MISSTGVPPIANIKQILLAKFWSKISQNKFELGDRVWISYGQNYVSFTSFFKPKVVLYGGFSKFVYSNLRSKITLKILCFFYVQFDRRPHGSCTCPCFALE